MSPRTVDELLDEARRRIRRLDPHAAWRAWLDGALLVDVRPTLQREIEGTIPGAVVVERNHFEWRSTSPATTAWPRSGITTTT